MRPAVVMVARAAGRTRQFALTALSTALLAWAAPATAQDADRPDPGWQFTVSPYLWIAGLDGSLGTPFPREPRVDIAASFGDAVTGLAGVPVIGAAEVRYGRFGVLGDILHLPLEQDVTTRGVLFSRGGARITTTGAALIGLYRVLDAPAGSLDFGGGVRPWWVTTKLTLDAGRAQARSARASADWVDPVIAVRGHVRLSERFGLTVYADVGGFGVGSDLTWQVLGTLDWQATDWLRVHAGYRHLAFDVDRNRLNLDVSLSGPILGATIRF
jgi:hypothetical protein